MGVDNALEGRAENAFDTGAGDQGIMFGFQPATQTAECTCKRFIPTSRERKTYPGFNHTCYGGYCKPVS